MTNQLRDRLSNDDLVMADFKSGSQLLTKAGPPGPPPRPGLEWHEETSRWWCGEDGCDIAHDHENKGKFDPGIPRVTSNGLRSLSIIQADPRDLKPTDVWKLVIQSGKKFDAVNAPSFVDLAHPKDLRYSSLHQYVGNKFALVNTFMRKVSNILNEIGIQQAQGIIKDIKSLMVTIEEPQIVYRGLMGKMKNYSTGELVQAGDIIKNDAFMSTSRNIITSLIFSDVDQGEEATVIEIYAGSQTRGVTLNTPEYETILDSGQEFLIHSIVTKTLPDTAYPVTYIVASVVEYPLDVVNKMQTVIKSGPPAPGEPPRPGLEWREQTHRWWCGEDGCDIAHDHSSDVKPAINSPSLGGTMDEWVLAGQHSQDVDVMIDPAYVDYEALKSDNGLRKYAGSINSYTVNSWLRHAHYSSVTVPKDISNTIRDMTKLMKPTRAGIVYRGTAAPLLDGFTQAKPGDVVTLTSFASTSRNPVIAAWHASEIFMEIRVEEGVKAIVLPNSISTSPNNEYETVFNYGQQIRIESITEKATIWGALGDRFAPAQDTRPYYVVTLLKND